MSDDERPKGTSDETPPPESGSNESPPWDNVWEGTTSADDSGVLKGSLALEESSTFRGSAEPPTSPPGRGSETFPSMHPKGDDQVSLIGTVLLGVVLFMATVAGGLFFELPILPVIPVVGAASVSYSEADLIGGAWSKQMIESARLEAEAKYGIDVSLIFTPRGQEASAAMRELADQCLPRVDQSTLTMPDTAHETFALATEYLACATRRNEARLCDPAERERLAEQLMQYLALREHLFGIEEARERQIARINSDKLAKVMMEIESKLMGEETNKSRRARNPKTSKHIDPRISSGLEELNRKGYFSISDLTWYVFFASVDYAPFLDPNEASQEPACS